MKHTIVRALRFAGADRERDRPAPPAPPVAVTDAAPR
jgi:hypothetical protein